MESFYDFLTNRFDYLFENDKDFFGVATRKTPKELARIVTVGLASNNASKDGRAVKDACKHFGIPNAYKSIHAFLNGD
jgi:hypothetical protein